MPPSARCSARSRSASTTTSLLVTYNGKTFDVPVMETRWLFHRMPMPLESVRHFDMLHPARRLWRGRVETRDDAGRAAAAAWRTLERVLCDVTRVGDVPGMEIPARYFRFLRSGDARPLEPVLEHNRLDLVSLAAVTAHALQLVERAARAAATRPKRWRWARSTSGPARVDRALDCYRHAAADSQSRQSTFAARRCIGSGLRLRRDRRFSDAAAHAGASCWS